MPQLKLNITFKRESGLVINPGELVEKYFFGIPICTQDGRELSYNTIRQQILSAQREVENLLYIKLFSQIIRETTNYISEEWSSWNFIKTSYLVKTPLLLEGRFNDMVQIGYPKDWLSVRKESSSVDYDRETNFRTIYVVPQGTTGNPTTNGITYNGVVPFVGLMGYRYTPNYWFVYYETGFNKVPSEIVDVIGKMASIALLSILGDIYLGVGMNSYSIGLDGLSQSTSLLKSQEGGIFMGRIKQYYRDLYGDQLKQGGLINMLKSKFIGVNFDVL